MNAKLNSPALEKQTKTLDGEMGAILQKFSSRINSIKGLAAQSPRILEEAKNFIKRNYIMVSKNKKGSINVHFCCSCLKAHIFNIARSLNIGENTTKTLCTMLPCRAGHLGYYMDADKLIKL